MNLSRRTWLLVTAVVVAGTVAGVWWRTPEAAVTHFENGERAFARGDFAKAQSEFAACVALAPGHAEGWVQLAKVDVERGELAAAARALSVGLAHCPTSPALHFARAQHLASTGRDEEALLEYDQTLRLRPGDAEAFVGGAEVCFRLGRSGQAVTALHRALEVEPAHPGALTLLAGQAIQSGDESGAREWLRRMRDQPRVPVETNGVLAEEFHQRFGRSP